MLKNQLTNEFSEPAELVDVRTVPLSGYFLVIPAQRLNFTRSIAVAKMRMEIGKG